MQKFISDRNVLSVQVITLHLHTENLICMQNEISSKQLWCVAFFISILYIERNGHISLRENETFLETEIRNILPFFRLDWIRSDHIHSCMAQSKYSLNEYRKRNTTQSIHLNVHHRGGHYHSHCIQYEFNRFHEIAINTWNIQRIIIRTFEFRMCSNLQNFRILNLNVK